MNLWNNLAATAVLVGSVATLAACGSDKNGASAAAGAEPTSTAAAAAKTSAPMPPVSPEAGIGVKIPLTKAPPRGKTIGWLQCSLPSCASFTTGFKSAAEALGWRLKTIVYEPGKPGPAVQQAINEKVDYMAMTGQPPVLFAPQLKAAKAAGIPLISANDTTPPDLQTGLATQFGDQSMFGNESTQIAQWMVNDSGGKAHIIYVTIQDYPILEAGFPPLKSTVAKYCSGCSVEKFPITVDDLGKGAVPAKLVAYLQSHPETNYVDFSFADVLTGVPGVLKSAGMADKVKLVGQALGGSPFVLKALKDRTVAAWVAQPNIYQTWLMVDAMARLSVGMPLTEERAAAKQPTWVADSPAAVGSLNTTSGWDGPPGYQKDFKVLWGV